MTRWILVLALLIALSMTAGYFYLAYFDSLPEAVVPDVAGLTFEAAAEKLEETGLRARMAGSVYETKYPQGAVVSQRPEGGRRVKIGRVVNLMVSSGQRQAVVPNLLGKPLSQAETLLAAAEFRPGEVRWERNLWSAEETILAQEPLPGEEADAGSGVDLLVSTTLEVVVEEGTGEVE